MAKVVSFVCDACGENLPELITDRKMIKYELDGDHKGLELCDTCNGKVVEVMLQATNVIRETTLKEKLSKFKQG